MATGFCANRATNRKILAERLGARHFCNRPSGKPTNYWDRGASFSQHQILAQISGKPRGVRRDAK
jgi:hypothetical protein